jgi:hypothetical protein
MLFAKSKLDHKKGISSRSPNEYVFECGCTPIQQVRAHKTQNSFSLNWLRENAFVYTLGHGAFDSPGVYTQKEPQAQECALGSGLPNVPWTVHTHVSMALFECVRSRCLHRLTLNSRCWGMYIGSGGGQSVGKAIAATVMDSAKQYHEQY